MTRLVLREIRQSISALDELAEARVDGRARKQVAENLDFAAKLFTRNGLDEFLRGDGRIAIEFLQLCSRSARHAQSITLRSDLAYQADRLRFGRIDAAAR